MTQHRKIVLIDTNEPKEVQCPCYLGAGKVSSGQEVRPCPTCEDYTTVPEEVARRFLEVVSRRLPGGKTG